MNERRRVALIGARGHTGAELVRLVDTHPALELVYASSRDLVGSRLSARVPGVTGELAYSSGDPSEIGSVAADCWILALPNGAGGAHLDAVGQAWPDAVIVDLSADHRFDDSWVYGLPEHNREALVGATRIANPGCYATAMQLAIHPMRRLQTMPAHVFGVSGYSGAGSTPSPKNDPEILRDNLLPYSLTGHVHEREASRHLEHPVCFTPHVAPFFRGITVTVSMHLARSFDVAEVVDLYRRHYADDDLVVVGEGAPLVRAAVGQHRCCIGGFAIGDDGQRLVVVATLDNLLKGAASQALQNINLALGYPELIGLL